jgi:hypothetical protein
MAFVAAPNIVQVEIMAALDGQRIENRVHVNCLHQPTSADLASIGTIVTSWCTSSYVDKLPAEVLIDTIRMTSLHTQNDIQLVSPVNIQGLQTGGAMPNEVTFCVSLRSAVIGRSARGRFYVLALARDVVTDNRISATQRTNLVNAVQGLRNALEAAAFPMTIVSYVNNGAPRAGGPVYFLVTSTTSQDDIVDSQRRRKPGVGS